MTEMSIANLQTDLNDFAPGVRTNALRTLASLARGEVSAEEPEIERVNMHCHTFFSFNAYGHSPTSLAWQGKQQGLQAMGIVDFDVLDGVDEFLDACEWVGLRGSAGIETRVFVPEVAAWEINSPGEPGVCYHMGIGLTSSHVPDSVAPILADLGRRADRRNREMVRRINDHLSPVTVDYRRDVLPLTPSGHPTERHLVMAYLRAAERAVADPPSFWASVLGVDRGEVVVLMPDQPALQDLIRGRLMKRGGAGYLDPAPERYPYLTAFHELIVACGALPCAAWLDGTTLAEQDPEAWLEFLVDKGVVALNIIPDRNWNIADPKIKQIKVDNLYRVVEVARQMALWLNVGTEMNSVGQKQVDDFSAPELLPVRDAFLDGAYGVYGHTKMQCALGLGYQSEWAREHLPTRCERNRFYTQIGRQWPPGQAGRACLEVLDATLSPGEILARIADTRG